MNDCVFCKIVAGEIPAYKLAEDENSLTFLDINPLNSGHSLVIPKRHVDEFQDIAETDYLAVMKAVKEIAGIIKQRLQPARVGLVVHGFDVSHAHVQVIPLFAANDLLTKHKHSADQSELKEMHKRLSKG